MIIIEIRLFLQEIQPFVLEILLILGARQIVLTPNTHIPGLLQLALTMILFQIQWHAPQLLQAT